MQFLEFLGTLSFIAIIIGIGYAFLKKSYDRDDKEKYIKENSDRIKKLNLEYRGHNGQIVNQNEYNEKVKQILNDPNEIKKISDEKKDLAERKRLYDIEENKIKSQRRRYANKYDEDICEIFGTFRSLTYQELIFRIENWFKIDELKAKELFELWYDNWLINTCEWNRSLYQVGIEISKPAKFKTDEFTREKWLQQKNLVLQKKSKEQLDYEGDIWLDYT